MKNKLKFIYGMAIVLMFSGCGGYFNQPVTQQKARAGETSATTEKLRSLPLPEEPIVVGVYNFKDQTGQYKNVENGSTFSTAVSQGGTTMLVKALEDSKWFTPIERENLQNMENVANMENRQNVENVENAANVQKEDEFDFFLFKKIF